MHFQRGLQGGGLSRVQRLAAGFGEQKTGGIGRGIEIEHVIQAAGDGVERALNALAVEPVVFDESSDGALIGDGVIDEIRFRLGRNHQQRKSRAVSAAALRVSRGGGNAGQSTCPGAAGAGSGQSIHRSGGLIDRWAASGGRTSHRSRHKRSPRRSSPRRRTALQEIDHVHDELLFIDRIGVAGMAILKTGGLQKTDRRKIAGAHSVVEIVDIVLMIARRRRLVQWCSRKWGEREWGWR